MELLIWCWVFYFLHPPWLKCRQLQGLKCECDKLLLSDLWNWRPMRRAACFSSPAHHISQICRSPSHLTQTHKRLMYLQCKAFHISIRWAKGFEWGVTHEIRCWFLAPMDAPPPRFGMHVVRESNAEFNHQHCEIATILQLLLLFIIIIS